MKTESLDVMTTQVFSVISKIERPTKIKSEYAYQVIATGIRSEDINGFEGLLLAEKVEQYEDGVWYEVDITRGNHVIKEIDSPGYSLMFEITRKDLPNTASVYQKSQKLYLNEVLCDLNDDEIIPINKQINDIAEMQDRQSDFTAEFKIRKTRRMRSLFELSGEVGANTTFPYLKQVARLVQDNIEMITGGILITDKVNELYYFVSILSGNLNFFKAIQDLKLTDLTLVSANHTWDLTDMAASHSSDLDYLYPLCEASDDGGLEYDKDDGTNKSLWGGFIWPFIKVRAIWDEIFSNAGFTAEGDILNNIKFNALYLPIQSIKVTDIEKYLYSMFWTGAGNIFGYLPAYGATLINGDENFRLGYYYLPFEATYKISVTIEIDPDLVPVLTVYKNGSPDGMMTYQNISGNKRNYTYDVDGVRDDVIRIYTTNALYYYYSMSIDDIKDAKIGYGSAIIMANYLPDMTQIEFIKTICNMFGLIPDVSPRDRKITFWSYADLYSNIPNARDWSEYLSEKEDEVEFKYGDYAQKNYLRYKDSDDVVLDTGIGIMRIDDSTLPEKKDVIQLDIATCGEVTVLASEVVSRINFNEYDDKTGLYVQNDSIDPRIVFQGQVGVTSPAKTLTLRSDYTIGVGTTIDITNPKKVSSVEISFSNLVTNYSYLSRMLTKTTLRRVKFNLPVYEVAGLKHNIPIYLKQYKAYFYINKINNYIPGKICTIELIKL